MTGLSLRHVAEEMDVALSTLTYVYPTVTSLLDDMVLDYRQWWRDHVATIVAGRGLEAELAAVTTDFLHEVLLTPERMAVAEYQVMRVFKEDGTHTSLQMGYLVDLIAERSGEEYALSRRVLANAMAASLNGILLFFTESKDLEMTRELFEVTVKATVHVAKPRRVDVSA